MTRKKVIHFFMPLTILSDYGLIILEVIYMSEKNMDFYDLYCQEVLKNEQLVKENKKLKVLISILF